MSTKRATGWYWLPAEPGEKVDWHPAFYDAERDRMWVAQCSGCWMAAVAGGALASGPGPVARAGRPAPSLPS